MLTISRRSLAGSRSRAKALRSAIPAGVGETRRQKLVARPLRFEPLESRQLLSVGMSGMVWQDLNHDGLLNAGEPGVAGAVVQIYSSTDNVIGNADDVLRRHRNHRRHRALCVLGTAGRIELLRDLPHSGGLHLHDPRGRQQPRGIQLSQLHGRDGAVHHPLRSNRHQHQRRSPGRCPAFGWAQNAANVTSYYTGNTPSFAGLVATDAAGNVYVAGTMNGTTDFDNGPGTYNLTASGPATFVAKYTSAGRWYGPRTSQAFGMLRGQLRWAPTAASTPPALSPARSISRPPPSLAKEPKTPLSRSWTPRATWFG